MEKEIIQLTDFLVVASVGNTVILLIDPKDKDKEDVKALQIDLMNGVSTVDNIQKFLKFTAFEQVSEDVSEQKLFRDIIYRKMPDEKILDSLISFQEIENE